MLSPKPPPYDVREWREKPFPERLRMVCQSWAHRLPKGGALEHGVRGDWARVRERTADGPLQPTPWRRALLSASGDHQDAPLPEDARAWGGPTERSRRSSLHRIPPLVVPAVTVELLIVPVAILPVLGLADKTIFLASRAEHYFTALVALPALGQDVPARPGSTEEALRRGYDYGRVVEGHGIPSDAPSRPGASDLASKSGR